MSNLGARMLAGYGSPHRCTPDMAAKLVVLKPVDGNVGNLPTIGSLPPGARRLAPS